MRYDDKDRESGNIEDRRGQGGGSAGGGGGRGGRMGFPLPIGRGGMSLTSLLIIGAIMLMLGMNPLDLLREGGGFPDLQLPRIEQGRPTQTSQRNPFDLPGSGGAPSQANQDEMKQFVARVLADMEDFWTKEFQQYGLRYEEPRLVLFSPATPTAYQAPFTRALGTEVAGLRKPSMNKLSM